VHPPSGTSNFIGASQIFTPNFRKVKIKLGKGKKERPNIEVMEKTERENSVL
jgi:hypothetical protein